MSLIPKRRRPEPMGLREQPQVRCPSHLSWIRGHCCAIEGKPGHTCGGKIEAAHVRIGTDGGMGVKPSDFYTIPLCAEGHALQHAIGEPAFERAFKISMLNIANELARKSPHKAKWLNR
jgi:hypothetical protein